jgi:NTE family protein
MLRNQNNYGIALALSGGVAKGWAHIGVLRALDEHKIPIKMIAGTSIGALVGGCYLAGKLDALEEFARGLTKRRIFSLLDIQLGGNGFLGGLKLDHKLQEHLNHVYFSDLSKPFVSVATEINTGNEIWLTSGSLINAMRASFAIPGIFEPVLCNGRLLVDGALVNPVPVSVCRNYEQTAVVAVNMHHDHFGRAAVIRHDAGTTNQQLISSAEPLNSTKKLGITGALVESLNIIQDRISRSKLAGDPPDMMICPKVGSIGIAEFDRAAEMIDLGYKAGIEKLKEIEDLLKDSSRYV